MGTVVAYARVSTGQQDYQAQLDRLKAAGATKLFSESWTDWLDRQPTSTRW